MENVNQEKNQIQEKKNNKILEFFMKTLNGMAYGLFATLIIGTIFGTIGTLFAYGAGNGFCDFFVNILKGHDGFIGLATILQCLTGAGIGVGIALSLKFDPLKTIVLAAVGEIAADPRGKEKQIHAAVEVTGDPFQCDLGPGALGVVQQDHHDGGRHHVFAVFEYGLKTHDAPPKRNVLRRLYQIPRDMASHKARRDIYRAER